MGLVVQLIKSLNNDSLRSLLKELALTSIMIIEVKVYNCYQIYLPQIQINFVSVV